jgi:hypothetical protein
MFHDYHRWFEGGQYFNCDPALGPLTGGVFRFVCDKQRTFTVKYDWNKQEVEFGFFLEKFYFHLDEVSKTVVWKQSLC